MIVHLVIINSRYPSVVGVFLTEEGAEKKKELLEKTLDPEQFPVRIERHKAQN